jgi:hypothetical protein
MKLILVDKYKKQKVEVLMQQFQGNLVQGIILSHSFDIEFKKKITEFENLVNTYQFSILDKVAAEIDAYGWEVSEKKWKIFDFQVFNEVDVSFRINDFYNDSGKKELYTKLEALGYDNRWIIYEYLTIEELNTQFALYEKALANAESVEAENGCQHTEHLRYGQFWKISEAQNSFTNEQLEKLIELVASDEDQVMSTNFYRDLLNKKKVTVAQVENFNELKSLS